MAIYVQNFILGHLIVATNSLENIDNYVCERNEVKLITPIYNTDTGDFIGLKTNLALIMLRGDPEEVFSVMDTIKKSRSCCIHMLNIEFQMSSILRKCFLKDEKHFREILNGRRKLEEFSNLFYYLSSTTNCKEKLNQFKNNVGSNPIDCTFEFLNFFSKNENISFQPNLLNSDDQELRNQQVEIMYNFLIIWLRPTMIIWFVTQTI